MNFNLIRNACRIGAIAGLFGAVYFSAKNGKAICDAFHDVNVNYAYQKQPKNRIKHYIRNAPKLIKPLAPTLACAGGTIACMAVSERISYKQIAALTATCVYLTKNRDFLEKKLEEVVGKERLAEIKQEFVKKEAEGMLNFPSVEVTANGDLLCLEGYSGRWFRSSLEAVEEAQAQLSKMHEEGMYVCFNDYYGLLGIAMSQFGHEFGWPASEDYCEPVLHFDNTLLEAGEWDEIGPDVRVKAHEPLLIIELDTMPMQCWMEV